MGGQMPQGMPNQPGQAGQPNMPGVGQMAQPGMQMGMGMGMGQPAQQGVMGQGTMGGFGAMPTPQQQPPSGGADDFDDFAGASTSDGFDAPANARHLTMCLEQCAKLMRARRANGRPFSERWVWFVDFFGYSLRDNNPRTMLLTKSLLDHYPEMLAKVVMWDAPWIFGGYQVQTCIHVLKRKRERENDVPK